MGSIGLEREMSESSTPSDTTSQRHNANLSPQKRSAGDAGIKPNGMRPHKSVKRRASKACQCCRSRKVRCNVVEHGAPCTNCRLDEVECIVSESKRKKYAPSSKRRLIEYTANFAAESGITAQRQRVRSSASHKASNDPRHFRCQQFRRMSR